MFNFTLSKNQFSFLSLILTFFLLFSANSSKAQIFVDATRPDDSGDGLSLATAKRTINAGVSVASINDNISISAGSYAGCTLDKSVNFVGAGIGITIIQGAGAGNGINITTNLTNVTIRDLTITNFQNGVSAASVAVTLTNFSLQNISVSANTTHGLFVNAATFAGLNITNSFFNNNGGVSGRGAWIFTQNVAHSNIVITNTQFNNNSLVGFDLAPHNSLNNLTITGCEARNNGDAGFSLYSGIASPASNQVIVRNNIIEIAGNQRFGMEIKNMVGNGNFTGAGSVVVSDNYIFKTSIGNNSRDFAGIAVICRRAGVPNAAYPEPSGVVIMNNTIENIQPGDGTCGSCSSVIGNGFGIVAGGQSHKILNNNITGCQIGVQLQGGNTNAATTSDSPSASGHTNTLYFDRDNSVSCNGTTVRQNNITGYTLNAVRNVQNSNFLPNNVVDYTGNFFGGVTFPIADIESHLVSNAGVAPTFVAFASTINSNAAFNPWATVDLDDTAGNLTTQRGVQQLTPKTYRAEADVVTRITTALLPIQQGILIANPLIKDILNIRSGVYPIAVVVSINKPITLLGDDGTQANQPILTMTADIIAILQANAQNITIDNLFLKVNPSITVNATGSRGKSGILANDNTSLLGLFYDNLVIQNNRIENINPGSLDFFAIGIRLCENNASVSAGRNRVTIQNNTIFSVPGNAVFGRGVRGIGNYGDILNNNFTSFYGVQIARILGGNLNVNLNTFNVAGDAGVEFNLPNQPASLHSISQNNFIGVTGAGATAMIEIKDNSNTITSNIVINDNTFTNFPNLGVLCGRSSNIAITNNTFTPRLLSTTHNAIYIDTKHRTTSGPAGAVTCDNITIQGNTLNDNGVLGGTGIGFGNYQSGAIAPFGTNVLIGGAGALANNFSPNIRTFIALDPVLGLSNLSPLYPSVLPSNNIITQVRPTDANFDARFNNFDVGAGLQVPTAMTNPQLIALENKISHRIEFQPLGFVTVKANHVFVTKNSFIAPFTTQPRIARGSGVPTADGFTLNVEDGIYLDDVTAIPNISFNMDFQPVIIIAGAVVQTPNLVMNGVGKVFNLLGDLTIDNQITFTNGNIVTNTNKLIFTSVAQDPAVATGEQNNSRIIGTSETVRNVGVGSLAFLGVDIPAGADLGVVTLRRTSGTIGAVTGIVNVSGNTSIECNWDILPTINSPRNGVVFSWLPALLNGKDQTNLAVWRFDAGLGAWEVKSANFSAPTTSPLFTTIPVNAAQFSKWTISDILNPLPLTWLYVRADVRQRANLQLPVVSWATVAEVNTAYFDVERSVDGRNFEKIGIVQAKGSSNINSQNEYSFDDLNALELAKNVLYYRLRQVDKNKVFVYSRIVSVNMLDRNESVFVGNIYPNPTNGVFNVSLNLKNTSSQSANMKIFDATGKILKTYLIKQDFSQFDLSDLPVGMYYLVFSDDKQTKTYKIVRN